MSENGTLTIYQRMTDPNESIKLLGNAIAKSGMFGCGSVEAGQVFAVECLHRNMPPLTLAERYHVIFGKLSMKAEAMLAGFEQAGGEYEEVERSADLASIKMTIKGKPRILSLSWADAQKEPFCYVGKEEDVVAKLLKNQTPPLKPKYATPRSRMQMLWARLVSDSVRFLCPSVVCGVYTPEEISDFDDAEQAAAGKRKTATAPVVAAETAEQVVASASPIATVVDAEFTTKSDAKNGQAPDAPNNPPVEVAVEFATADQRQKIEVLFAGLGMTGDQIEKSIKKRNATSLRNLPAAVAVELMATLEAAYEKKLKANGQQIIPTCGPCTVDQEQSIKAKLLEWKQTDPPKYKVFYDGLAKKLADSGRKGILQLSANDAARLYQHVQNKSIDGFLSLTLEAWQPAEKSAATQPQSLTQTQAEQPKSAA